MRRFADFSILAALFIVSLPYVLDRRWWVVLACAIISLVWLLQSHQEAELGLNFSLFFLVGAVAAGIFLNYPPLLQLTSLMVLLAAWNLDHLSRDLQRFKNPADDLEPASSLAPARLKRLAFTLGLGWVLGAIALSIRVSLPFAGVLTLAILAVFLPLRIIRYLRAEDDLPDNSAGIDP